MGLLTEFLQAQDFKQLLTRIGAPAGSGSGVPSRRPVDGGKPATAAAATPSTATPTAAGARWRDRLPADHRDCRARKLGGRGPQQGYLAVDTETSSLNAAAEMVGVSMALAPGRACYVPLRLGGAPVTADGQGGLALDADIVQPTQIPFDAATRC